MTNSRLLIDVWHKPDASSALYVCMARLVECRSENAITTPKVFPGPTRQATLVGPVATSSRI